MMINNRHERIIAAAPERITALILDLDRIWPVQIAPAPRLRGNRLYDAGLMLWEEYDRPGAARAFRVAEPAGLQGEHWFELGWHKAGPFCATPSRATRPGRTRLSGVSGSSRSMT